MSKRTKQAGVYWVNLDHGWFYIGSSHDLDRRNQQHSVTLAGNKHFNQHMQRRWNKYHIYEFIILDTCAESERLDKEQALLDAHFHHPNNLNQSPTAGGTTGFVFSDESRLKLSVAHKTSTAAKAALAKLHASQIGKKMSAASCRAKSDATKGIPKSDITKQRMSAWQKGLPKSAIRRRALRGE